MAAGNQVDYLPGATTDGQYFGKYPTTVKCPKCNEYVKTQVQQVETSQAAKDLACACFLTGCFCCACIPCHENNQPDHEHHCPQCGTLIGRAYADDIQVA